MGFQVTGWKALLALAGIAAFAGFRYYTRVSTLEKEGREALHLWLAAEYSRDVLESIPSNAAAAPAEQQAAAEELPLNRMWRSTIYGLADAATRSSFEQRSR
jgi:hypothetical protein